MTIGCYQEGIKNGFINPQLSLENFQTLLKKDFENSKLSGLIIQTFQWESYLDYLSNYYGRIKKQEAGTQEYLIEIAPTAYAFFKEEIEKTNQQNDVQEMEEIHLSQNQNVDHIIGKLKHRIWMEKRITRHLQEKLYQLKYEIDFFKTQSERQIQELTEIRKQMKKLEKENQDFFSRLMLNGIYPTENSY